MEMVAMLVLSVLVALMTAAAMAGLEATTLDFLAETSMSMASSSTWTAKSMAWESSLMIFSGRPAMERVRSSTYTLVMIMLAHLACRALMRSSMSTRSSEVAKPEPAVMPLVATITLEYTPSTPMDRASL